MSLAYPDESVLDSPRHAALIRPDGRIDTDALDAAELPWLWSEDRPVAGPDWLGVVSVPDQTD